MASEGGSAIESDKRIDHQCSVCKKSNKKVEADTYCVDCQDYYCKICVDIHKTVPALENHKIVAKDVASGGEALPSVPTSRCGRHRAKIIDMYCQDHDEVGCTTCMTVDHRNCKGVFYIPEYVQTNSTVVPKFLQSIQDVESELKAFLNTFQLELQLLLQTKHAVVDQIQKLRMRLENSIRKATEDAIQKVDDKYAKRNAELQVKIISLKDEIDSINNTYKVTKSCSYNVSQAFVESKKETICIAAAKQVKDDMKGVELDRRLVFVPQNVYEAILRNTVTSLGNITLTPYVYEISTIGNIDLTSLQTDKPSTFYDSCCTSDGSIFFTDMTNKILIRICSESMKVVEQIDFPSAPYGVCCISDNEIAVCLSRTIQILQFHDRIQLTRTINMNDFCGGISCHEDTLYVASKNCVNQYTMDGTLLQSYKKDSDGNNIFSNVWNVVVNPFSKHIHITDIDNGVITMDQKGSVVNIVKDISPCGITLDKCGQVFVSHCTSDNIIQLNCEGKYIQPVILTGLCGPSALCFDGTMRRVYLLRCSARDITVCSAK